jgi:arsenate reductase-like glutaredoxin family protein
MIDLSQKKAIMDQIHKRFSNEQIKVLFQCYTKTSITRDKLEKILQISKTRFFTMLKEYRRDPAAFSIAYKRDTPARLSIETEAAIATELLAEKALIEDPDLPIYDYNYLAMRDRLKTKGFTVSATTITK